MVFRWRKGLSFNSLQTLLKLKDVLLAQEKVFYFRVFKAVAGRRSGRGRYGFSIIIAGGFDLHIFDADEMLSDFISESVLRRFGEGLEVKMIFRFRNLLEIVLASLFKRLQLRRIPASLLILFVCLKLLPL